MDNMVLLILLLECILKSSKPTDNALKNVGAVHKHGQT